MTDTNIVLHGNVSTLGQEALLDLCKVWIQ